MSAALPVARARPPIPTEVVGMAVFLFSETTLFAGLIGSFLILRSQYGRWPPIGQPAFPVGVTGVVTGVLVISGLLVWRAGRMAGAERARALRTASLLGAVFLVVQGLEWVGMVREGLDVYAGTYAAIFTAVIGAHGLHVLAALVTLGIVAGRDARGVYSAGRDGGLHAARLFWMFVVGVWPAIYGLVYLW